MRASCALVLIGLVASPNVGYAEGRSFAVLDPKVEAEVTKGLASGLAALTLRRLMEFGHKVVSQDEIRQMIGYDEMRVALSCEEDASCLSEIGSALGVTYLLMSRISKIGSRHIATISLVQVEDASVLERVVYEWSSDDEAIESHTAAVDVVLQPVTMKIREAKPKERGRRKKAAPEATPTHAIRFESEPSGAEVRAGGRKLCTRTPCSVEMTEGSYAINIRKRGFAEWNKLVKVVGPDAIAARLSGAGTKVVLVSPDPEMMLYVDERPVGPPPVDLQLAPGAHAVRGESKCRSSRKTPFNVAPNSPIRVVVRGAPKTRLVRIESDLEGEVQQGDRTLGTFPGVVQIPTCSKMVAFRAESQGQEHRNFFPLNDPLPTQLDVSVGKSHDAAWWGVGLAAGVTGLVAATLAVTGMFLGPGAGAAVAFLGTAVIGSVTAYVSAVPAYGGLLSLLPSGGAFLGCLIGTPLALGAGSSNLPLAFGSIAATTIVGTATGAAVASLAKSALEESTLEVTAPNEPAQNY